MVDCIRLLHFLLALYIVLLIPTMACSCLAPPPTQEALKDADAVFIGKVTGIQEPVIPPGGIISSEDLIKITFEVSGIWKGDVGRTTTITTSRDSASCGYNFEKGERYLVYGYLDGDTLTTNLCTRTKLLSEAQEDLTFLGEGRNPTEPTGAYEFFFSLVITLLFLVVVAAVLHPLKKRSGKKLPKMVRRGEKINI